MNRSSEYKYISPGEVKVTARKNKREVTRIINIKIGETYVISPVNYMPHDSRRGRVCIVKYLRGPMATVEFLDTKRLKKIPLDDLSEYNDENE